MKRFLIRLPIYSIIGIVIVGGVTGVCYQLDLENKSFLMVLGYWSFSLAESVAHIIENKITGDE